MTNSLLDRTRPFFGDATKLFVGIDTFEKQFEDLQKNLKQVSNYPPYNIKKTGENTYMIEMAVAGFGKSDIEITLEEDKLIVKGNAVKEEEDVATLFSGLALRPFTRMFTLHDQVEVKDAEMLNGLLKVFLERVIPEEKKPKSIEIK